MILHLLGICFGRKQKSHYAKNEKKMIQIGPILVTGRNSTKFYKRKFVILIFFGST